MIELALIELLRAHTGLTDLVNNRIYAVVGDQKGALPFVTFERLSAMRSAQLDGCGDGIVKAEFEIVSRAAKYKQSKLLAEQVRLALQHFSGGVLGAKVNIHFAFLESDSDFYEEKTKHHMVIQDWEITYVERTA